MPAVGVDKVSEMPGGPREIRAGERIHEEVALSSHSRKVVRSLPFCAASASTSRTTTREP